MTLPLDLEPENPAVVYLESLSKGSYWAVRHSLETIAKILAGEDADPWTFPWDELRYQHTARVRRQLVDRYAPATVNKMLSALRGVLEERLAARVDGRRHLQPGRRGRERASQGAAERQGGESGGGGSALPGVREDQSPAGRRDAAMFAVLYGGGLRRAELCGLDLADFDSEDCSLLVRAGKGRRDRTVYLPESVCEHLKAWVATREEEPGPLFCPVRSTGEVPISRLRGETLWYILGKRQREAGLEGITPHSLRRFYVTTLLDAGVDLLTVQELVGHSDAVTTARYDRRGVRTRKEAARSLSVPADCDLR